MEQEEDKSPPGGDGNNQSSTDNADNKEQITDWVKKAELMGPGGLRSLFQSEYVKNYLLQTQQISILPSQIKTGASKCVSSITGNDCTHNAKLDCTKPKR